MSCSLWIVYAHINRINGKQYIGITSRKPEIRWGNNGIGYSSQPYFWNAIKKYGWNNFEHKILFTNLSLEEAQQKEIELIKERHTYIYDEKSNGYNMTLGGEGANGNKFSEELKSKLSEMRKGENNSFYGKQHTDESKEKMSKKRKGKNLGEENSFFGNKHSQETKDKLSYYASQRIGDKNPNYGNHKIAGENHPMYGKHLSDETKEKISKSRIGKYKGINNAHSKPVYCYETNKIYSSATEAGEQLNMDNSSIGKCCKGKLDSIKNYHFRYATKEEYYGRY